MEITRENIDDLVQMIGGKVVEYVRAELAIDPYMTIEEAARYARVSVRKMRTWIKDGPVETFQETPKSNHLVLRESLDRWINSKRLRI